MSKRRQKGRKGLLPDWLFRLVVVITFSIEMIVFTAVVVKAVVSSPFRLAGWLKLTVAEWRELPSDVQKTIKTALSTAAGISSTMAVPVLAWVIGPVWGTGSLDWQATMYLWLITTVLGLVPSFYSVSAVIDYVKSCPLKHDLLWVLSTTVGYIPAVMSLRLVARMVARIEVDWLHTIAQATIVLLPLGVMAVTVFFVETKICIPIERRPVSAAAPVPVEPESQPQIQVVT